MKHLLSNIRIHKCKIFYTLFGIYLFSLFITFIVGQGIQLDFSETEFNNVDNKINLGFQLTDLIELNDSEEETESKVHFLYSFCKDTFSAKINLNSNEFNYITKGSYSNFSLFKLPKYLLIHQLIVYS